MNARDPIIDEVLMLETVTIDVVAGLGFVHRYSDLLGTVEIEVPAEAAHYDEENKLIWVEINPERLPRPYTCHDLVSAGIEAAVSESFGSPVLVEVRGGTLFIAAQTGSAQSVAGVPPIESLPASMPV